MEIRIPMKLGVLKLSNAGLRFFSLVIATLVCACALFFAAESHNQEPGNAQAIDGVAQAEAAGLSAEPDSHYA